MNVAATEAGLSDHSLVSFTIPPLLAATVYTTVESRNWRSLDVDQFILTTEQSILAQPISPSDDATVLADRFQRTITDLLDHFAPLTTKTIRIRPRRRYYDADCHKARRAARKLERRYN